MNMWTVVAAPLWGVWVALIIAGVLGSIIMVMELRKGITSEAVQCFGALCAIFTASAVVGAAALWMGS